MTAKRQALVTGANKGIGFAIAKGLAEADLTVWMAARDRSRGEAAAARLRAEGYDAHFVEMDVASDNSVARAAFWLADHIEALDVLVNNAGVLIDAASPPSALAMADIKASFEVNVFGPIRVTQSLLPLLKKADSARVVMMGSGVGSLTLITDPTSIYSTVNLLDYTASKVALNAVTVAFAKEFSAWGIKVNVVEPGHVRTDLNGNTGFLSVEEGAESAIKMALIGPDGPTGCFFGKEGPQPW